MHLHLNLSIPWGQIRHGITPSYVSRHAGVLATYPVTNSSMVRACFVEQTQEEDSKNRFSITASTPALFLLSIIAYNCVNNNNNKGAG